MASIMSMQEFFYGESEPVAYPKFYYEHMHPTTYDLMMPMRGVRKAVLVTGTVEDMARDRYKKRVKDSAHAFGSGASCCCNDGVEYRKSRLVQQGNRDRRSYVDSTDSLRYARTFCPGYREAAAITHYVSVNPTMATRVESGVAWSN